ncbi:hypothetical protein ZWY2020_019648 [Hordeum vulgare]|nr:hypothetical protein ZWY2020_019648 [Hordeum vulgare]
MSGFTLAALASAGVTGVAVELGLVGRRARARGPREVRLGWVLDLAAMARRATGSSACAPSSPFHQCGARPHMTNSALLLLVLPRVPLPQWVLEEMEKMPDLSYTDRYKQRNKEYISLGCDILPLLKGRSPMQAYADFMRSFDNFKIHASIIECLCEDSRDSRVGGGGPAGIDSTQQNPEETNFFRAKGGCWNTPYGRFFLSGIQECFFSMERLCAVADAVFSGTGVTISGKVSGIHWHYYTCSHPSELTAGYYNTLLRDGYLPILKCSLDTEPPCAAAVLT